MWGLQETIIRIPITTRISGRGEKQRDRERERERERQRERGRQTERERERDGEMEIESDVVDATTQRCGEQSLQIIPWCPQRANKKTAWYLIEQARFFTAQKTWHLPHPGHHRLWCSGACDYNQIANIPTYHGPPKPTFLEVFMVNNLVFRWP